MSANPARTSHLHAADELERETQQTAPGVVRTEEAACQYCFGSGMEIVAGRGACRCHRRTGNRRKHLLEAARIPRRFSERSFLSYRAANNNDSRLRAFAFARRLVQEYPAVERGLLFMGPRGVGKTHLSVA